MRLVRPGAYMAWSAAICLCSFLLCWLYVAVLPMTFLDEEFPRWQAKQVLLSRCELGQYTVFGDSRAAVDVAPARLPIPVTNLALAGTTSVETFVAVQRALRCPQKPRAILLSISPSHLAAPDTFWGKSVRYRFLSLRDLLEIRDTAERLHDPAILTPEAPDGLSPTLRIWLYEARFPSLYFGSLWNNGPFMRYGRNRRLFHAVLQARGQYFFASRAGPTAIGPEGELSDFQPEPLLDAYFDRILAAAAARNVPVYFVAMPLDQETYDAVPRVERDEFADYLRRYAAKYPGFHILGDTMPHWPNQYFGDSLSHMNPDGVAAFNAILGQSLARIAAGAAPDTIGSAYSLALEQRD